jgi:hypothetical protein
MALAPIVVKNFVTFEGIKRLKRKGIKLQKKKNEKKRFHRENSNYGSIRFRVNIVLNL